MPRNFYSSLTDRNISDKEYNNVPKVWNITEMKSMKDYHDLYLKCGMLLLAGVFGKKIEKRIMDYVECTRFKLGCNT